MVSKALRFSLDDDVFDNVLIARDGDLGSVPTVLVFHGMEGRSDAQVAIAERLTAWGYQAVAVDAFGEAVSRGGAERCAEEMTRFLSDRRGRPTGCREC